MLLIVGLGNPGPDYARNRHNVGFIAVDAIQRRHRFPSWRRRFQGDAAESTLAGEKVLLLKPQTFMNESGRSVQEAAHFYKIDPKDILVIHDEVDLPPGKTRMKIGGGAAGHNGLRSIDASIGDGYRRLRIGIGHPGVKAAVPHYVLHDFPKEDAEWLVPLIDTIADNAALLAEGKDNTFANRLHAAGNSAADMPDPPKGTPVAMPAKIAPVSPEPDKRHGPFAGLKKLFGG
jgi:peptidyl-tRNA hydrolase, PTH1 family